MTTELEATLQALCEDLTHAETAASPQSVREILESMQRLVSTFGAARRVLGRLLWRSPEAVQRALYEPASAVATLRLLAALAVDSVANQRRIARHLTGVWLPQRPKSEHRLREEPQLFVLTLPSALRVQYKQWNRRRRELRGRRLPSGDAPRIDGVPAPCLCDDCLGADQLLATWLQHFRDLSKWSASSSAPNDSEPAAAVAAAKEDEATHDATRLSAHAFLATVLRDSHELRRDVVRTTNQNAVLTEAAAVAAAEPSVVYYFVPKSQRAAETPMDPLQHVCAIAMQRDELDATKSQCCRRWQPTADAVGDSVDTKEMLESLERVELWVTEMDIEHCDATQEDASAVSDDPPSPETRDDASSVVDCIRSFLEPTVELPSELLELFAQLRRRPTRLQLPMQLQAHEMSQCAVRFLVDITQQRLQIESRVLESSEVFAASVARANLDLLSSADSEDDAFALLRVDGESLRQLTLRLCDHRDEQHHTRDSIRSIITLRRQHKTEIQSTEPTEDAAAAAAAVVATTTAAVAAAAVTATPTSRRCVVDVPLPGLEDVSTQLLQQLEHDLALDSALTPPQVIAVFVRVIRQCDARMTALATASQLSEAARSAARERCRGCRDLLVRASKRIRLCAEASTQCAALSTDGRAIARKTIARVLRDSAAVESWERRDERVERLQLSRHAWSSGVPDAEFFVDSAARARERKRIQQRLNRQLQQQRHHGDR
ncbi:hypothetical protein PINS_up021845 [Pythium insidiosum]|nr:hypothetical protein PINS_up021845 [Pythium insidiosum]